MLRAAPLESCSPPGQAPAHVTPSLPRRSARLQLRATSHHINTSVPSIPSSPSSGTVSTLWEVPNQSTIQSENRMNVQNGRGPLIQLPPLLSFSTMSDDINHESADVHLDQSNHGFSFINLHWASFSTGLSSVLTVIISLGLIAGCSYVGGRRQRQSRARHTELLRTIIHGATKAVSTTPQQQSGAYPEPPPSLQPAAVQRLPSLLSIADDRIVFEPPVIPARGSTAYPVVRYAPASSVSCGLPGCSTTYGRLPARQTRRSRHQVPHAPLRGLAHP